MNVIIYTRVSTEEQTKGNGLQFQERDIRSHCQLSGKVILKHYQEDHSAKNFNRPVFQELVATESDILSQVFFAVLTFVSIQSTTGDIL